MKFLGGTYCFLSNKNMEKKILNQTTKTELLSLDFIAGIIAVTGSFLWANRNNELIPVFQIKMQATHKDLVTLVRDSLKLKEKVYEYKHQDRKYVLLLIRKRSTIEHKLVPAIDGRLYGQAQVKFELWLRRYYLKKYKYRQHI